jgi:L-fuconolactonase
MVTEADWQNWRPEDLKPYLDIALDRFGPERLMIGSDWPVCTVAASYKQTMSVVLDYLYKYPVNVQDAVLGGNAQRFWKLKLP